MRWIAIALALPAAAGGFVAAHRVRASADRQGAPPTRSAAIERLLRDAASGAVDVATLSAGDRAHPWVAFLTTPRTDADLRAFADQHRGTGPGARALHLWVSAATDDAQRARRRAVFRAQYPRSWVVAAWGGTRRP